MKHTFQPSAADILIYFVQSKNCCLLLLKALILKTKKMLRLKFQSVYVDARISV